MKKIGGTDWKNHLTYGGEIVQINPELIQRLTITCGQMSVSELDASDSRLGPDFSACLKVGNTLQYDDPEAHAPFELSPNPFLLAFRDVRP
jgi:hypothetical protein